MIKAFCHLSEWHQASQSDNFIVCPALFEWPCHFATHWLSQDVDTDPHTKSTISLIYCDPHKDHKYPLIPRRTFQRPPKPPKPRLASCQSLDWTTWDPPKRSEPTKTPYHTPWLPHDPHNYLCAMLWRSKTPRTSIRPQKAAWVPFKTPPTYWSPVNLKNFKIHQDLLVSKLPWASSKDLHDPMTPLTPMIPKLPPSPLFMKLFRLFQWFWVIFLSLYMRYERGVAPPLPPPHVWEWGFGDLGWTWCSVYGRSSRRLWWIFGRDVWGEAFSSGAGRGKNPRGGAGWAGRGKKINWSKNSTKGCKLLLGDL